MIRSKLFRHSSIRAALGALAFSGLVLAPRPSYGDSQYPSAAHKSALVHMAADPDAAEKALSMGRLPVEKLDYALFLHAYRPHTKANRAHVETLLTDMKNAIAAEGDYWGKGSIGEPQFYNGSDASLIAVIRAVALTGAGGSASTNYVIPCGVLQKRPALLEATEPMFGGSGDMSVPQSGCKEGLGSVAGFPDKLVQTYMALADRADGCIGCGTGTIRYTLTAQVTVMQERMRLDPRFFLRRDGNIEEPKQAYPYQAWSYLSLANRRVGARIQANYDRTRPALAAYYRGLGLSSPQAERAARLALFGTPFGARCGEQAVTTSLRTLVLDGADATTIRRFIAHKKVRPAAQDDAIARCADGADRDPMAHVALRDPRIFSLLSRMAQDLDPQQREMLDLEMDVNQPNGFGKTPLMTAAQFGLTDSANYLLDHGASINIATEKEGLHADSRTALHYAAASGSLPMIRLLVARGADTGARDGVGIPAMWFGVKDTPGDLTPLDYFKGDGPVEVRLSLPLQEKGEVITLLGGKP